MVNKEHWPQTNVRSNNEASDIISENTTQDEVQHLPIFMITESFVLNQAICPALHFCNKQRKNRTNHRKFHHDYPTNEAYNNLPRT